MSDFVIENGVLKKYTGNGGDVVIPDGVTDIDKEAFNNYRYMSSVVIPESVKTIGYRAFDGCTGLTSVTIRNGLKSIGRYAFYWCISLTSIVIPDSVTEIRNNAFEGCQSLTSVVIENSIAEIGKCAFDECRSLKDLFIKGYHIRGDFENSYNFTETLLTNLSILESRNFSAVLESAMKYPCILAYYRKTKDETALTYIKKQFSRIIAYAMEQNDIETIEALTAVENLFTKKNIDKLIEKAIDKNAHEIYVILLNYKNEHFGYTDIEKRFKL